MANILSATEAANVLRCDESDPDMLALLPLVDDYIKNATGRNWSADETIEPTAKSAARMLITLWHENPGMSFLKDGSMLGTGFTACLTQLESIALQTKEFFGKSGPGMVPLVGAYQGDVVDSLVGIVGEEGDQSNAFETFISRDGHIKQISDSDLSEIMFRVKLISPGEL